MQLPTHEKFPYHCNVIGSSKTETYVLQSLSSAQMGFEPMTSN